MILERAHVLPWLEDWRAWLAERGIDLNQVREIDTEAHTAFVWLINDQGKRYWDPDDPVQFDSRGNRVAAHAIAPIERFVDVPPYREAAPRP